MLLAPEPELEPEPAVEFEPAAPAVDAAFPVGTVELPPDEGAPVGEPPVPELELGTGTESMFVHVAAAFAAEFPCVYGRNMRLPSESSCTRDVTPAK